MTQVQQERHDGQERPGGRVRPHRRLRTEDLPAGGVVSVLLDQHARIRELFALTAAARGEGRRSAFGELRGLLAAHEAGEAAVVRPVSVRACDGVADERDQEEKRMTAALADLADLAELDIDGAEFAAGFGDLEREVSGHLDAEEHEEFPFILAVLARDKQVELGARLLDLRRTAPPGPESGRAAAGDS